NRYGVQTVDLAGADLLLLPAALSLTGPATPLADPAVDAFACYRAKAAKGQPALAKGTTAFVDDAFGGALYALTKPRHLCRPVDGAGAERGAAQPRGELLCYKAKPVKKVCQAAPSTACSSDSDCGGPCVAQAKPAGPEDAQIADALGARALAAGKPKEICLPS